MVTTRRRVAPSGTGVIPGTEPGTVAPGFVARRGPVTDRDGAPEEPADEGRFFASVMPVPSSYVPKNAYYAQVVGAGLWTFPNPNPPHGCKGRARRSLGDFVAESWGLVKCLRQATSQ